MARIDGAAPVAQQVIARLGRGQNIRIPHNLLVLMRALFLMENTVRCLSPQFNLMDGLVGKAEQVLKASAATSNMEEMTARLRYETGLAAQELPVSLSALVRRLRSEGLQLRLHHHGLEDLEGHIDRSSNRMALALWFTFRLVRGITRSGRL